MPSDLDVTHKLPQIFTNVGVQESGAAAEAAHHSAYSRLSGFGNSMASSGRDSTNYFSSAAMSATAAAGMAASHLNPYAVIIPEYTYHIVTKYVVSCHRQLIVRYMYVGSCSHKIWQAFKEI